ncbi:hypothetical protein VTJ83DRAFT_1347 [Remersonia thermophila]|uniref:Uncharacterized protein n=1 Tax=Remersonia thermophila TaxID=72144 RepID=A0ABR4DP41_9PEZI
MSALTPPSEFLAACPKFRVLVLGSPESTKQELFTKVFGVDLEKRYVDEAFSPSHAIATPLDLRGQNSRVDIFTCLNFGPGGGGDDEANYARVSDFLAARASPAAPLQDRLHAIWYCVASEEGRAVSDLERRFFGVAGRGGLCDVAPGVPVVLVFTKYDDFVERVRLGWSHNAEEKGLSKVAVSYILRDLAAKRFEHEIGRRWDEVLLPNGASPGAAAVVPRVCVSSPDTDEDARSFEALAEATLARLRDRSVKYAFAAAQRISAPICTRYCADTASEYFEVSTAHARKLHGVDARDILPDFFAKAVQLFNLRDPASVLDPPAPPPAPEAGLLARVLFATFDASRRPLVRDELLRAGTDAGSLVLGLTPHDRAVLLAQTLAGVLLFLHRLADAQWPHGALPASYALGEATLARHVEDLSASEAERRAALEEVEASPVFTQCALRGSVAELLVRAIERADKIRDGKAGSRHPGKARTPVTVEDDSELKEIATRFATDKTPVLPCGLTILPLTPEP